jgi:uncharacterized membrane protein
MSGRVQGRIESLDVLRGLGAGIAVLRGRDQHAVSRFLWTRGVWLIIVELTLIISGLRSIPPTRLSSGR